MEGVFKRRDDDQIISRLVNLWPLAAAIVSGIVCVSLLKFRVDNHEERMIKIERSVEELQGIKSNTQLLVDVLVNKSHELRRHREED